MGCDATWPPFGVILVTSAIVALQIGQPEDASHARFEKHDDRGRQGSVMPDAWNADADVNLLCNLTRLPPTLLGGSPFSVQSKGTLKRNSTFQDECHLTFEIIVISVFV